MPLSEMGTPTQTCPVCGIESARPVYSEARDPITLDCFSVAECVACGVAYTKPRPSSWERYYPEQYRAYGPITTGVLSMFYNLRASRWMRVKPEKGGKVLEIGCGPGLMLAAFHRNGWRVLGIERNEAVAAAARRALGLEIISAAVEELPMDAQFDLIVMFQVLEHIGGPLQLLIECAKRLAPGGRLIINVPNFSSWQSRFAGPKWLHLDVPRHVVHFTPQTLATTLERAGLRLVELRFTSMEHDPYGWVESTVNLLTGRCNTLTRFLMGLDPFGPAVLLSFVLGVVLVPPAFLLATASWLAGSGALMEAVAADSNARM